MKKIMFNEAYGLTQATIEGRKTNTRRNEFDEAEQARLNIYAEHGDMPFIEDNWVMVRDSEGTLLFSKPTRYKVGEVVAVAQSYERIYEELLKISKYEAGLYEELHSRKPGWRNKMVTEAVRMPHCIRITGIRAERLQDISDADCIKEGICCDPNAPFYFYGVQVGVDMIGLGETRRSAFAALIDKVSGRSTWASNPWVVAYEYELVK